MARTVVGLFNSAAEAQQAVDRLLASGFEGSKFHLATQETLRAQQLPAANARADTAVLTVDAATEDQADQARATLDACGAIDVYKQAAATGRLAAPNQTDDIVDLEGGLGRVRDGDELDANGLTTH
jgi:hypothetical protein